MIFFNKLVKNEKGFLTLFDGILAILMITIVLIGFNIAINMENSSYSFETNDFLISQDTLEIMARKIDGNSNSLLETIKYNLEKNNNSNKSINEMSILAGDFLNKTLANKNYCLIEINQLNGKTIASNNNDLNLATNLSSSTRHIDNYIFILYVW